MKSGKKPLSIKIIYWLTQITFWLVVLVFFAAIAINVALQAELFGDDMQLHTVLPVQVNYTEKGTLHIDQAVQEVAFVEAIGKLHFINTNEYLAKWFGVVLLVAIFICCIFSSCSKTLFPMYTGELFLSVTISGCYRKYHTVSWACGCFSKCTAGCFITSWPDTLNLNIWR